MPLLKEEVVAKAVSVFINLTRDEKTIKDNIRISSNHISILDDDGEIIEEVVPLGKILPINLENEQISERSLLNSLDNFLAGHNLTVLMVGASFSGKERLFDGNKNEQPLAYHFVERLFATLKLKYRKYELRMKIGLVAKEKIYDCNSDNKYGILKIRENDWEGVEVLNMTAIPIDGPEDFRKELQRAVKQKNRLVLEFKDLYTSYLTLTLVREGEEQEHGKIISTATFIEVPGVELLAQPHNAARSKQSSLSTKSLFNFASILNDLSKNSQAIVEYDSILGLLLKDTLCGNSQLVFYFQLKAEDIQGSRGTIKFLKLAQNLSQYPVVNQGAIFGLIRKFRAEALARKGKQIDKQGQEQKGFLQNEIQRVKTEDDYSRLLEKYSQLKNKYNHSLKAKSEAQLELIKCEEEKLEIGKSLVEVQIENTKLLEKLQNKDYENGKKIMQTDNKLAKRQISYQESLEKLSELNISLNDALEGKRDLEVEFIALKRNFFMLQKEIKTLKEDNQSLSLDVINLSNENERLKKDFMSNTRVDDRSRLMLNLQNEKQDEFKRDSKRQEETIAYMKGEIERYKKELIEREMSFQKQGRQSGLSGYGKDYDRIQLENDNAELQNRIKLQQRRIDEFQDKLGFFEEENNQLQNEVKQLRARNAREVNEYRQKLDELTRGSNVQAIVKELRENFAKKDGESITRYNNLKQSDSLKKKEMAALKAHMRSLLSLMEEWAPKENDLPALRKFKTLDLNDQTGVDELSQLRIKNMRLEEQLDIRRLKASGGTSKVSGLPSIRPEQIRESRVTQQYKYLRNSQLGSNEVNKLRDQNAKLAEQNRRLAIFLKDGNKVDISMVKRQSDALNDTLRRKMDHPRNQSSVSPSTNNQKLIYYEKHLKNLEKERSQLLSRCTVAEEQVKNMLGKVGRAKG